MILFALKDIHLVWRPPKERGKLNFKKTIPMVSHNYEIRVHSHDIKKS